jgi:feruloyl esterase
MNRFLLLVIACVAAAFEQHTFEAKCLSFNPAYNVWNATQTQLQFVPAGTNMTFPGNDPTCNRNSQVVSVNLCRVALSVPTSNRSNIILELWLPEQWTGRTLATGNGGIDGCKLLYFRCFRKYKPMERTSDSRRLGIKYEDIAYGVANGFATVGTNNGHNGTYGNAFYHNDDVVVDFAWRS